MVPGIYLNILCHHSVYFQFNCVFDVVQQSLAYNNREIATVEDGRMVKSLEKEHICMPTIRFTEETG